MYVITFSYPFQKEFIGGGHSIALGFANSLVSKDQDVSLIVPGDIDYEYFGLSNQVKVRSVKNNRSLIVRQIYIVFELIKLTMRKKINGVIFFNGESFFFNVITLCLFRSKTCEYVATPEIPEFSKIKTRRQNFEIYIQYLSLRFLKTKCFSITDYLKYQMVTRWCLKANQVEVLMPGVDDVFLSGKDELKSFDPSELKLVSVGRLEFKQKPIDAVLEALTSVSNINVKSFKIIGDGPDRDKLQKIKDKNKSDYVEILGSRNKKEIVNIISECDVVILPSTHESLMLTAYEAMALKKILIINDVANLKRDLAGFANVIFAEDTKSITYQKCLEDILSFKGQKKIDEADYALLVKNFSWNNKAERIINEFTRP